MDIATESNTIRQAQQFLQRERQHLRRKHWFLKEQRSTKRPRVFVLYLLVVKSDKEDNSCCYDSYIAFVLSQTKNYIN